MSYFSIVKINLKAVVLLFILSSVSVCQLYSQSPADLRLADSTALAKLYEETDGLNWRFKTNWPNKPLTSGWYGVTFRTQRVQGLVLDANNLKGKIPEELKNLTRLNVLSLYGNSLSGTIPAELMSLPSLVTLQLYNNSLEGDLPPFGSSRLTTYVIYGNKFNFSNLLKSNIEPSTFPNYYYAPQALLPAPEISFNGSEVTLTVTEVSEGNHYTWYINHVSVDDADASSFTFTPTESSEVFVLITNEKYTLPIITQGDYFRHLVLETLPVLIEPVQQNIAVVVHDPAAVCEPATVDITDAEVTSGSTEGLKFTYFSDEALSNLISPQEASALVSSGTYYIVGTDIISGLSDVKPVVVVVNPKPVISGIVDAVTCIGGNDGSINLSVSAGKTPYSFNWSNGKTDENINDLSVDAYTVTVTDANKCFSTADFSVTQFDPELPQVLTQNITAELGADGSVSISAADVNDGSTDNCGIETIVVSPSDFTCDDKGPNAVTLTVADASGNESTATAIVTVVDNAAPTAIARNITIELDADGLATITASQVDSISTDNCGIASMDVTPSTFTCANKGPNAVTLTVTDASGNVSTATAIVTVVDNAAPTAIARNITVELDADGLATITASQVDSISTDNCGIASMDVTPSTFTCANKGPNTVTLTVADASGNVSTATAIVTVVDNAAPTAIARNITVELDADGLATITASQVDSISTDNCGIASMDVTPSTFTCANKGPNTVTLTVADASGNVSTATAIVTVVDNAAPTAIARNITVELDADGLATITASQVDSISTDNCGIASMDVTPSTFTCANKGPNTVTLTVADASGKNSTATAIVTVVDNAAPTAIARNITVELDADGLATITASQVDSISTDNCGIASMDVTPSTFTCANKGPNTVTLTVADASGNVSTATAIVTVVDNAAPTAIARNITAELGADGSVSISAADVNDGSTDNCGIETIVVSPSDFTCDDKGDNEVILTVTDVNGNVSTATATVTVVDNAAPEAIAQDITVVLGADGSAKITAEQIGKGSTDNCGIVSRVITPSNFSCSNKGPNAVTLTVADASGNESTASATVTIVDNAAPEAIAQDIIVVLGADGSAKITAEQINDGSTDNCGIETIVVSPSDFTCDDKGDNEVILTVTDVNGNVSTATAIVTVVDNAAPVAIAKSITVELGTGGSVSVAASQIDNNSTDNCGIVSRVITPSIFTSSNIGPNTITLIVADASGNESTASATVTVKDNSAPVAIAKDITVELGANGSVSITVAQIDNGSYDNTGIASMEVSPSVFDCSNTGNNQVTLTVTDIDGNKALALAVVTVLDKKAPVLIAPSDIKKDIGTKTCGGGGYAVDLGTPVVTDNCTVKSVTNNAPKLFPLGRTVVTWTAIDMSGNKSTAVQLVEIINSVPTNNLPKIISITSNSPVVLGKSVDMNAEFTDDNLKTAVWYWGDGTSSVGTISQNEIFGSYIYKAPGSYSVTLKITDAYGKTATKVYNYVVVTDPNCGDITGGGWIYTKKGDYRLKQTCEKGNFGFAAHYDKYGNLNGNLTFHMNGVNFHVHSTSLSWLKITDEHAIFMGKAKVNGTQGFEFLVSAIDIDYNKGCSKNLDMLRIIVWNSKGDIIFDNQSGSTNEARPVNQISQGSIVIHGCKCKNSDSGLKSFDLNETESGSIDIALFDNLKVYPNPASNGLNVEIPLRVEQAVSFEIIDITGRSISNNLSLGLYGQYGWINLDQFNMAPGFYILKLNEINGSQTAMYQFIKK